MPTYRIQNVVGNADTRTHRAQAAVHHRSKLFVGGRRLIRGNQVEIGEDVFKANEAELYRLLASGQITITGPDGTKLTSPATGKILAHAPGKAVEEVSLTAVSRVVPAPVVQKDKTPMETLVDKAVEMSDLEEIESTPADSSSSAPWTPAESDARPERFEHNKSKKRR